MPKLLAPGRLLALPLDEETSALVSESSVGWFAPEGVRDWSGEVSVVRRSDLSADVRRSLGVVLPEEQLPEARLPNAQRAAAQAGWLAVSPSLVATLRSAGIRIHTVGADRLTSRFYYEAKGGGAEVAFECDLVEFASSLSGELARNDVLTRALITNVDRLLRTLSAGALGEHDLLLAARLPRISNDGTGLGNVAVERFEEDAARAEDAARPFAADVEELLRALAAAGTASSVKIPLFGTAEKRVEPTVQLNLGGQALVLAEASYWVVRGAPSRLRTVAAKSPSTPPSTLSGLGLPAPALAPDDLDHLRRVVSEAPPPPASVEVSSMLEDAVREATAEPPAVAPAAASSSVKSFPSAQKTMVMTAMGGSPASEPAATPSTPAPAAEPQKTIALQAVAAPAPAVAPEPAPAPQPAAQVPVAAPASSAAQGLWFVILLLGIAFLIWRGR